MPATRLLSCSAVVVLLTLSAAVSVAQPTVPRDRVPAIPSSIRPFVDRLYSPDPRQRAEAACQIGRRHAEASSAIPVLLSMLGDEVLVTTLDCEMSPWLRRELATNPDALKWSQTSPAQEAAEALGEIGNASIPGLLQALTHGDWKVRSFAAYGLGEVDVIIEPIPVIDALSGTLSDAHPNVRDRSAWALGEIEHVAGVEPLLKALQDSEPRVRSRAAWALGEIEDPSAVQGLVRALSDSDASVREKSVWALGEIESESAVEGLLPLLGDPTPNVRRRVVWALGEIESPSAIQGLLQTLTDSDPDVRRQSAWALGEIEHSTAVSGLVSALKDEDWQVRKNAAWALGEIEDPSAIDALRAAANDSNNQVRRAVDYALGELSDKRRRRQ